MENEFSQVGQTSRNRRTKFLLGGGLLVAAIIYLIASSTQAAAQYYLTIDELVEQPALADEREVRMSGAVDGATIQYEAETLTLSFTVVNVPGDLDAIEQGGGLAQVLHEAVSDPTAARLPVVYEGPMPDLLRHEAQAIVTGRLGEDGVFYADELLLKCPTRYEEDVPVQAAEA